MMRFSKSAKFQLLIANGPSTASLHCVPSPDGKYIATFFPSVVNVRAVRNLEVVNVVSLSQDFSGPVVSFQWSPSSRLLLIASAGEIRIVSAVDNSFNASVRNPVAVGTKPAYIGFGPSDAEICVIAAFGMKFAIYNLESSKAVEIANPKLFSPSTASRCFGFRPQTRHLALLTRVAGKDMVSIHAFPTRELQRSWAPDTIDAQGLVWSPDGRWLILWESAAHGHKLLFYTSDGHIFRTWSGPANPPAELRDYALGAGIRCVQFSADARYLAIGDHSRALSMFSMTSVTEAVRLQHPTSLVPKDTVQIWQEQVGVAQTGPSIHTFMRTTQIITPPFRPDATDPASGCVSIQFDPSSTLVVTRLDDSPGTAWIWDVQVAELRAVLVFHGSIRSLSWHPSVRETLLVRCEGDPYNGMVFIWDPLSEGPRTVEMARHLPGGKTVGRTRAFWLGLDAAEPPTLFLSDAQNYILASSIESADVEPPWGEHGTPEMTGHDRAARREESPLELVPAEEATIQGMANDEDDSELEDTFVHKR